MREDRVEFFRFFGVRLRVFRVFRIPFVGELRATFADVLVEERVNVVVDRKLLLGVEPVEFLRAGDFLVAQRRAVRAGGSLFRRSAVSDAAVDDDERRTVVRRLERVERAAERGQIVDVVDDFDVPAVGGEARGHVFRERDRDVPFDRDAVKVVNPAEIRELQTARKGRRFGGNPLHHAPVAAERVRLRVEKFEARTIITSREPRVCHREADARRDARAERAGRRFHAARTAVFRMTGTF